MPFFFPPCFDYATKVARDVLERVLGTPRRALPFRVQLVPPIANDVLGLLWKRSRPSREHSR